MFGVSIYWLRALCLAALWVAAPGQAGDIYVQIHNIPGEATESQHRNWITASSILFGGSKEGTGPFHSEVFLSKETDLATPRLARAVAAGTRLGSVYIDFLKAVGTEGPAAVFKLKLDGAIAIRHHSESSRDKASDSLSLAYEKITWTAYFLDRTGKPVDVSSYWDLINQVGGNTIVPPTLVLSGVWIPGQKIRLSWPNVAGEQFQVLGSTNLNGGFGVVGTLNTPTAGTAVYELPGSLPMQFFVVKRVD